MGITPILPLVKTHYALKLLLVHWSSGFWKYLNDNYWDGSNKRNSKVEVEGIRQADGKVEGISLPRWVVRTPGGRRWEHQAEKELWGWERLGRGGTGAILGVAMRDRGGSQQGLKTLGSGIWNMRFWRRKMGARGQRLEVTGISAEHSPRQF